MNSPIDIWDTDTYDPELYSVLDDNSEMIRNYFFASARHELEGRDDVILRCAPVPHAEEFTRLTEQVERLMERRIIRAWHYTRLTDGEVEGFQRNGIQLSTLDTIRARLAAQVASGTFSEAVAKRLVADSPFQDAMQHKARNKRFCMVTPPVSVDNRGVTPLLKRWGGEALYFWQREPELQALLESIGRPRVLEIAVPLGHLASAFRATQEVVATFGRALGCQPETNGFDLHIQQPLGPEHILAIHSEGDATFSALARGYPTGYIEAQDR